MECRRASVLACAIACVSGAEQFLAKDQSLLRPASKDSWLDPEKFERTCESSDDFGYPRFGTLEDLQKSAWAEYYMSTYGELPPADAFPVCVFDFWTITNTTLFPKLGLKPDPSKAGGRPHGWQLPTALANIVSQFYPGIAYRYSKGEYANGDLYGSVLTGSASFTVYHDWYFYHQLPDNAWGEVQHSAGPFFKRETEAMWFSRARGSGIWYNVGKTIAFDTHQAGYNQFLVEKSGPCKLPKPETNSTDPMAAGAVFENALSMCLRSKDYDSFQMRPYPYPVLNTFGQAGWMEMASTRAQGRFACGFEEGGVSKLFRSGWRASKPCDCDSSKVALNCKLGNEAILQKTLEVTTSRDSIIA